MKRKFKGLRLQLFMKMFLSLVPIIVVVILVLGIRATQSAKSIIEEELAQSSMNTLQQSDLYIQSIAKQIAEYSNLIIQNDSTVYSDGNGATKTFKSVLGEDANTWNVFQKASIVKAVENNVLKTVKESNKAFQSIWLIQDKRMIYGMPQVSDDWNNKIVYTDIVGYEQIQEVEEKYKSVGKWTPLHKEEFMSPGNPVISFIRWVRLKSPKNGSNYDGVMVLNVRPEIFDPVVKGAADTGNVSMVLDGSGNVLAHSDAKLVGTSVASESYYQAVMSEKESIGVLPEFEKTYFVSYDKIVETGWVIVTLKPIATIMEKFNHFQKEIGLIGVACLVVAIGITILLALSITQVIKRIIQVTQKVEQGDFTARTHIVRHDEMGQLSKSVDHMLDNIQRLIKNAVETSHEVDEVADAVLRTSQTNQEAAMQVSMAIENVSKGMEDQVEQVNHGFGVVEQLAKHINLVVENTSEVQNSSKEANQLSVSGLREVSELSDNTQEMNQVISAIMVSIQELGQSSGKIGEIVQTITSISEETNLLSLNSSIEAARAGEAGRGFAVVATEVRKLAQESAKAAQQIDQIIREIVQSVQKTEGIAKSVNQMNTSQANSVEKTVHVFNKISNALEHVENHIQTLHHSMEEMSGYKDQMMQSMEHIHEVTEDSASASEEITASSIEQGNNMAHMTGYVASLNQITGALKETLSQYQV